MAFIARPQTPSAPLRSQPTNNPAHTLTPMAIESIETPSSSHNGVGRRMIRSYGVWLHPAVYLLSYISRLDPPISNSPIQVLRVSNRKSKATCLITTNGLLAYPNSKSVYQSLHITSQSSQSPTSFPKCATTKHSFPCGLWIFTPHSPATNPHTPYPNTYPTNHIIPSQRRHRFAFAHSLHHPQNPSLIPKNDP